jgi:GT2 family glycosyltransferase
MTAAGPEAPRVAMVTVLYHSRPFLGALLESIAALHYPKHRLELHVVDNSPGDGSLDAVRGEVKRLGAEIPELVVHEPGKNVGFAMGSNLGLRAALARGVDYCFLINPDASFEPDALREAVTVAESDPRIGSVQSLLVIQDTPDIVNTRGDCIHYLGFGYVGGYQEPRAAVPDSVLDIAYASGACALLPARVLAQVGLFDEILWLYHEDLDLGWRLLTHGYRNVLAPRSVCRHAYRPLQSMEKWYFMERNRWLVVLKNYRWQTVLLLSLPLLVGDLALLVLSARAGWWREKLRAMAYLLRPRTWSYVARSRRVLSRQRRIPDRHVLPSFTAVIAYPGFQTPLITTVFEPLSKALFLALKVAVRW